MLQNRLFSRHIQPPARASPGDNPKVTAWDLDTPLLRLSPQDAWNIRDACEGVQIFGAIGSGKTSGSGAAIAQSFLRSGFGGLVLCAKPEERQLWEQYAAATGRSNHLVIVSPQHPWRFNYLDYELRREGKGGGLTENLVALLTAVTEIVEGKQEQANGDRFWERAMRELLRNAIDLLALARGTLTLEEICTLIMDAPQSLEEVGSARWQQSSFCAECITAASEKKKSVRESHDFEMAARYWLKNFPALADRTRTSIVATFTSIADMLLHGIAWELFCTTTNLVPEVTYKDGIIILLDLPVQEYHALGRIAQGIFKYMFQRAILRRDVNVYPRPVFLWADEAQNFVSSFDYQAQAVARSARLCTVYLTQNISNYYSVLGSRGRDEANALLGNFQTKIFHANSDHPTNQYAADLISQEQTTTYNYSASSHGQGGSVSAGGSDTVRYKVLPAAFTTLRKGGPPNGLQVDAILFQGGRIWQASGDTYLKATFSQR
jgi:type IV secretory pathway TraG/TraD family ATPase VirD4